MQVIYEGKDIFPAIDVHKCEVIDNAGGRADSIELNFSDSKGEWSRYQPKRGDTVKVIHKGFDTGLCFADVVAQSRGICTAMATPLPLHSKTKHTQAWENIRFHEFAAEIAGRYGFTFKPYEIENPLYSRVEQICVPDFAFLQKRCVFEGYTLKVTDRSLVVYNERTFEKKPPVRTIYRQQVDGDFNLKRKTSDIYTSCTVSYNGITAQTVDTSIMASDFSVSNVYVSSPAEAKRFSQGLLRNKNKQQYTGRLIIPLDMTLAAGATLQLQDFGLSDGRYFIDSVTHSTVDSCTTLRLRQTIEGY